MARKSYSKLDEPNDNILLTLIRYGFSLSSNSIICLCSYEINKFDFKGYEIFEDIGTSGYDTERRKIVINVIKEKIFKLGDKLMIVDGLKDILNSKKIINGKINQNKVLLFEEKGDGIYSQKNKQKIINFIQLDSKEILYFENNFDIDYKNFYLLIRNNPCYLSEKNEKNALYTDLYLNDIVEEKLNNKIDELFKRMKGDLFDTNKLEKEIRCIYCRKKQEKNMQELYYIDADENVFFHESFFLKKIIEIEI